MVVQFQIMKLISIKDEIRPSVIVVIRNYFALEFRVPVKFVLNNTKLIWPDWWKCFITACRTIYDKKKYLNHHEFFKFEPHFENLNPPRIQKKRCSMKLSQTATDEQDNEQQQQQ